MIKKEIYIKFLNQRPMPFFTKKSLESPTQQDATKKKYPKLKILKKPKIFIIPKNIFLGFLKLKMNNETET